MPRDACSFVLVKQGVANLLHLLLCLLSCRGGFFLLVFFLSALTSFAMVKPFSLLISSATLAALLLTKVVS